MASAALLSCLGVCGWGPLHLLLPDRGEPEALLARLRLAWWLECIPGEGPPPAARLLASLLRSQGDLQPVSGPVSAARLVLLRHRHRLVCPPGEQGLRLRSWRCVPTGLPWRACGPELPLEAALAGAGSPPRYALPGPAWVSPPPGQDSAAVALR